MAAPRIKPALLAGGLLILFSIATLRQVVAHPMPGSVVYLRVLGKSIQGEANIPLLELESALGLTGNTTDHKITAGFLREYFLKHIQATSGTQRWHTTILALDTTSQTDPIIGQYQEVQVHFRLTPPEEVLQDFTFNYDAVVHQVITHSIAVYLMSATVADQQAAALEPVGVIQLDIPSGKIQPLELDVKPQTPWQNLSSMIVYGMYHVATGLDHLLFLVTLLLVAPLTIMERQWSGFQGTAYTGRRFLRISLAFTMGHSATLLLGTLRLIPTHEQTVEVLVAASILVSAIHAMRPLFYNREVLLALGFGLIHGLAFSFSLASLDLDWQSRLWTLFGFNLGIELMQLIVMLVCIPLLLLSRWRGFPWVRTSLAAIIGAIAIAWMVERISGQPNAITSWLG